MKAEDGEVEGSRGVQVPQQQHSLRTVLSTWHILSPLTFATILGKTHGESMLQISKPEDKETCPQSST
ncbi:hypothetical protein KGF36_19825, partial [Clostridioides sp. ZZV14-6009]|nr:hypothetical protein [Clostridioides sp. ZZV14-6009]